MENNKGLTLSGITGLHALHVLNAVLMVAAGIYLTTHYYDTLYPSGGLNSASALCDVSAFWNCDVATHSKVAAIAGVPIAFLGLLNGLFLLGASIFASESYERTASAVTKYNAIGAVGLLIFSLVALKGLCPVCTIYYILSWVAAALFWKKGINSWVPDTKVAGIWLAVTLASAVGISQYTAGRAAKVQGMSAQIVTQYQALADYGDPEPASAFHIYSSTPNFADAPIRVSVFSDFQCPFCKSVAEQMPQLARLYAGKINIQYFFYPLDSNCNASVKSAMHPFACRAAMLAACDPAKFEAVHDEIFAKQEGLNLDVLKAIADKHELTACFDAQSTRDAVLASINGATKFNLRSTPTIIINGKKIEGSISNPHYQAIFDHLLKK
jgi:protein-disulfide isomerase